MSRPRIAALCALCVALGLNGCRSSGRVPLRSGAVTERSSVGCTFMFSSSPRAVTLRTHRGARPFARLADDATSFDGRVSVDAGDPRRATVVLDGDALSLEGQMDTDDVPLHPARPLLFEGVVLASSAASVRARDWLPGGRVVVELPEIRFITAHAPLRATVRCRDLQAKAGEGSPRNADAGVWLSGGPPIPFARSPGGPPVVSLTSFRDSWDGAVRFMSVKERSMEIELRLEAEHSLQGWVPAGRVVIRPTEPPGEGERPGAPSAAPLSGRGVSGRPHRPSRTRYQPFAETRCKGALGLHARIGRDVYRVGQVKPGAAMVLDPEVLDGWRVAYLEEPWFGLERGVELVVSSRDLETARCGEP